MLILLDTEFTSLLEPELLSVGMVTSTEPAQEFYAEVDTATEQGAALVRRASDMVREAVLPQWGVIADAHATPSEMGRRAGEWLLAMHVQHLAEDGHQGRRLEIGYDYSTDYELLQYVIRDAGLWDSVREIVRPVHVGGIAGSVEAELAAEACFAELRRRHLRRHHALADALALRASYLAVKSRLMSAFGGDGVVP